MKLIVMVWLMLVVGCAGASGRHELRDGATAEHAPVFVTPGHTPAGAGLPEYMPVEETPKAERSPHHRVLPPTPEPRIYSGDEPHAAVHPETGEPVPDDPLLLGVRLPFAPEAQTDIGKLPTKLCAFHMNLALELSRMLPAAERLNSFQKKCIAARLYEHCASFNRALYKDEVAKTKRLDEVVMNRARNVDREAKRFMEESCRRLQPNDDDADVIDDIVRKTASLWEKDASR